MQTGGTNRNNTSLYLSATYILAAFFGIALFLYFYIFQVPSLFSVKRFVFSFACSALVTALVFGLLIYRKNFYRVMEKTNFPVLFLQAFLLSCYFIFFIPMPENHLFSKQITLHAEFQNETNTNAPVEILWVNNGLRDISYADIQYASGEVIDNDAITLTYNDQGIADFSWQGPAWKQVTIVARSSEPFSAVYDINGGTHTFDYIPQTNQDFRMQIPIHALLAQILAVFLVLLSSVITFSLLLFVMKLILRIKLFTDSKIQVKQSLWTFSLAMPLTGILLYLIRIGFYNRLYSDDYCYLLTVDKDGYFSAINDALHKLNGRFMSHITDFFLFIWKDALMPFGMLLSILLLVGSLMFLFNQLIDNRNKLHKFLLSLTLSAMITLTTFFIVPFIYESAFWALHVWVVFGGVALFNTAIAIILRVSQKSTTRIQIQFTGAGLLALGFISCGFHENTGMLILLLTGSLWLLITLFLRQHFVFNKAGKLLFRYLVGSLAGFLTIVFMPGEQGRLSFMNVSYTIDRTLLSTYHLTLVKLDVLYESFRNWGFIVILSTALFAFLMGKLVSVPKAFSQIEIRNKPAASLMFLFPFLLFVISFVPSTFINNYYPNRTLIVPIYFFVFTLFMTAFFSGIQQRENANQSLNRLFSTLIAFVLIGIYIAHFIPIGNQFAQFANEWDQRDSEIKANANMNLTEMYVAPYEHSFGIDISTTNNLFLSQCYDEYYGIHVIPPQ